MIKDNNYNNYHIRRWYYHIDETLANENGILADGQIIKNYCCRRNTKSIF